MEGMAKLTIHKTIDATSMPIWFSVNILKKKMAILPLAASSTEAGTGSIVFIKNTELAQIIPLKSGISMPNALIMRTNCSMKMRYFKAE